MVVTVRPVYEAAAGGVGFGAKPTYFRTKLSSFRQLASKSQTTACKSRNYATQETRQTEECDREPECLVYPKPVDARSRAKKKQKVVRTLWGHNVVSTRQAAAQDLVSEGICTLAVSLDDAEIQRKRSQQTVSALCDKLENMTSLLDSDEDSSLAGSESNELEGRAELYPEPEDVLQSCPRILTLPMIRQLVEKGLPESFASTVWERIYASERDGDAFLTMLESCERYKDTIVVIRTSKSHILGGYAAATWQKQNAGNNLFYGNGRSFLFADHPAGLFDEQKESKELHVYPWSGCNLYSQMCNVQEGKLAMGGGGGSFGFILEDNFSRGSTGCCNTFQSPPLIPCRHGTFEVTAFEVYGCRAHAQVAFPTAS